MFLDSKFGKVSIKHDKNNEKSAVILAHGYRSDKNSSTNQELSKRLKEEGTSTIALDLYGHGESEGDITNLTLTKAISGLLAAHDFARSEGYEKIGIVGSSFSGQLSLLAASKKHFDVIGLKCPVFDFKTLSDEQLGTAGIEKWRNERIIAPFGSPLHFEFYEDCSEYDMPLILRKIKSPTLVVHGAKDETVSLAHAENIIHFLGGEKKLVVLEEADHFFKDEKSFKMMSNVLSSWLVYHLE